MYIQKTKAGSCEPAFVLCDVFYDLRRRILTQRRSQI